MNTATTIARLSITATPDGKLWLAIPASAENIAARAATPEAAALSAAKAAGFPPGTYRAGQLGDAYVFLPEAAEHVRTPVGPLFTIPAPSTTKGA